MCGYYLSTGNSLQNWIGARVNHMTWFTVCLVERLQLKCMNKLRIAFFLKYSHTRLPVVCVVHFSGGFHPNSNVLSSALVIFDKHVVHVHTQPLQHYRATKCNQPCSNHQVLAVSLRSKKQAQRTRINKASTYALPFIPSTAKVRYDV